MCIRDRPSSYLSAMNVLVSAGKPWVESDVWWACSHSVSYSDTFVDVQLWYNKYKPTGHLFRGTAQRCIENGWLPLSNIIIPRKIFPKFFGHSQLSLHLPLSQILLHVLHARHLFLFCPRFIVTRFIRWFDNTEIFHKTTWDGTQKAQK